MECLTWTEFEAILDECLVTAAALTSQNLSTSISLVHKEWMTYLLHVGTDLMGTTRFQDALHQGGIAETLQHHIMSNRTLADTAIRVENLHAETVLRVTSDITLDASLIFYDVSPYQGVVAAILPPMTLHQELDYQGILATERFTQHPARYTEASLVRKMEELGIGRPSTYAPTISTIQQRQYVEKGDREGTERNYNVLSLRENEIKDEALVEMVGRERSKLMPTDVGIVVNDFLTEFFPNILDFNFTANIEKEFDEVATGHKEWTEIMHVFYNNFHPAVVETLAVKMEHKVGERLLGVDPKSGKPLSVKIGRYGPIAQIGSAEDEEKPQFSSLRKGQSIETITLEEALDLFKLPRTVGEFEDLDVVIGVGRFGPYVLHNKKYTSVPKTFDPMEITLEESIQLIKDKREQEAKQHIKSFAEEPELEVKNGRYGPYIAYSGKNYKIPKDIVPENLTLEACLNIVETEKTKSETKAKKGKTKAKAAKTTKDVKAAKKTTAKKATTKKTATKTTTIRRFLCTTFQALSSKALNSECNRQVF